MGTMHAKIYSVKLKTYISEYKCYIMPKCLLCPKDPNLILLSPIKTACHIPQLFLIFIVPSAHSSIIRFYLTWLQIKFACNQNPGQCRSLYKCKPILTIQLASSIQTACCLLFKSNQNCAKFKGSNQDQSNV